MGTKISVDKAPDSPRALREIGRADIQDPASKEGAASAMPGGLTAAEVQELVENRVASLFRLSNMGHPVQMALRQLCVHRLSKKLKSSL